MTNQSIDNTHHHVIDSELGRKSDYDPTYNPERLFPIARSQKRLEIGINPNQLPFYGFDIWNHYEVSWLNAKGKPVVALAQIAYDCQSPYLIESKSLKLYFNSFNNTKFNDPDTLQYTIKRDLEKFIDDEVHVKLLEMNCSPVFTRPSGSCLDKLDIECSTYKVTPSFLKTDHQMVHERVYSNLLKSNCLVTHQPDWGSIEIEYKGQQINKTGLLQYIISFRNHNEFHEQCIERIFMDILTHCKPEELTVYGRYTRRGGLDINPYRSTTKKSLNEINNNRFIRQ